MNRNVVICIPVLLLGGTEVQVLSVINVLVLGGYCVTVCCYYEYDEMMVAEMRAAGARVILMGLRRSDGLFHLIEKLRTLFKQEKPDIVHVQYLAPGLIPIIAARTAGISTIFATVHIAGSVAYGWREKLLLRIAARLSTVFFCASKGVEEFWFGNSEVFEPAKYYKRRKHFTIYNTVDVTRIEQVVDGVVRSELLKSLGIAGGHVIGIVGRLAHQKGHTYLLDAMVEVLKQFTEVCLLVIGDGPERSVLEEKAVKLGINHHILWLGALPQGQVFELCGIMDVFAMPSLYEGFGLAAAEAMAAGLPVVGTGVDGLSEIIEDGLTGYLVPVGDSHELAKALIELLLHPEESIKMGNKGRARVQRLFAKERFNKSMLAAYESLAKKGTINKHP